MRSSRRILIAMALLVCAAGYSNAQQATPLVFAREDIRITSPAAVTVITSTTPETPKADAEKPEKDAADTSAPAMPAAAGHPPLTFNVEVRSEDALRLEYIHTLNSLTDTGGVIISFTVPSNYNLPAYRVPTPVDALFVMENGSIEQIIPNVVLNDLTQEITARKPFKGFLFLKAGTVTAKGIKPKDMVSASAFNASPALVR